MHKQIGNRLASLRINAGLTQDELADKLNKKYNKKLSKITISKIENGSRNLSQKMSLIYCDYFNVSLDWILGLNRTTFNKEVIQKIKDDLFDKIIKEKDLIYNIIRENNLNLDFDEFTNKSEFDDFIIYADLLDLDISEYNPDLLGFLDLASDNFIILKQQKQLLKITTKINNIKDIDELIKIAEIKTTLKQEN